jgi:hypothetical protein
MPNRFSVLLVCDASDGAEVGFGRRQPGAVHRVGVEVGVVIIGDAACVAVGRRVGLEDVAEQGLGVLLALLVGDEEAADARAVGWNLGGLHPAAVGIAIEIVARLRRLVHPGEVDAGLRPPRLLGRGLVAGLLAGGECERGDEEEEKRAIHWRAFRRCGCFALPLASG